MIQHDDQILMVKPIFKSAIKKNLEFKDPRNGEDRELNQEEWAQKQQVENHNKMQEQQH